MVRPSLVGRGYRQRPQPRSHLTFRQHGKSPAPVKTGTRRKGRGPNSGTDDQGSAAHGRASTARAPAGVVQLPDQGLAAVELPGIGSVWNLPVLPCRPGSTAPNQLH